MQQDVVRRVKAHGQEEIDEPIVVIVSPDHILRARSDIPNAGSRHICESAVVIVAVELRGPAEWIADSFDQIEIAVVVVVRPGATERVDVIGGEERRQHLGEGPVPVVGVAVIELSAPETGDEQIQPAVVVEIAPGYGRGTTRRGTRPAVDSRKEVVSSKNVAGETSNQTGDHKDSGFHGSLATGE